MAGQGVLAGVRVLDLSRMLSGPYCTMMLADHGAEVIKVEGPGGDTSRSNGPYRDDDPEREWAGYFVSLNRGKKSIRLDLKTDEGREAFLTLARTADVVVENFRPGVMERLGLSYERLAEENRALVYAAIRGFGDPRSGASPYVDWPSYDVVAQAMGGIIALTGPDAQTPTKVGPGVGDIFTGLMMSFGVIAALRRAEATGEGQFVDLAMYDAVLSLCERAIYQHDFDGSVPGPEGAGHPLLAPFGLFPASDGMVALGIVDDGFWRALADAMGMPDLGVDPRFAKKAERRKNADDLNRIVADWTGGQSKAALTEALGGVVPFGPVNTVADIYDDPHVSARGMIMTAPHPDPARRGWRVAANPLRFAGDGSPAPSAPPRLGEHNQLYLDDGAVDRALTISWLDGDQRRSLNATSSARVGWPACTAYSVPAAQAGAVWPEVGALIGVNIQGPGAAASDHPLRLSDAAGFRLQHLAAVVELGDQTLLICRSDEKDP